MTKNYGSQIRAFVDYINAVSDFHFPSVAQFVYALRKEPIRCAIGKFVEGFFHQKVMKKSSNSSGNWWGAINYCYKLHAVSLKSYAPAILKRSILRGYHSLSHPTEGFFTSEWIQLIHEGYTSGDPEIVLETLFLVYMMRMSLRSDTTAKLSAFSPMLVRKGNSKLLELHQWAIEAKNCQYSLNHLPTFSKVTEEPESPHKKYICAVWALQQISRFRKQYNITNRGFVFNLKNESPSPNTWRKTVANRLVAFQERVKLTHPHVGYIRIGGHTPRKTYANIATSFNLTDKEIRMVMRNRSMNCIRRHYINCSRAHALTSSWGSHLKTFIMKPTDVTKGISSFTKSFTDKDRKNYFAEEDLSD